MSTVEATDLTRTVGRFVPVPAAHARYDTDAASAERWLRLPAGQIERLAEAGLSHVDDARGPLFDYTDLVNVAMFSGSGQSVPELALRFLLRFAASPPDSWFVPRDWLVGIRLPQVPGAVRVRVPDLSAEGVSAVPEAERYGLAAPAGTDQLAEGYRAVVRLTGARHTVRDPRVRAVWTDVVGALVSGSVIYQTVTESLRTAHHEAWASGMADCIVVARLLADRIRDIGLPARARRGYLLGLVGSDHAWCEVHEDGVWKNLDAVFAFVASGGGRDRNLAMDAPEFAAACFGSRFNRLLPCTGDEAESLVYFGDRPAPPWALAGVSARPWRVGA
jgi:hypothetical protein